MATCTVRWCGKSSRKSNYKTDGITFHRFPQEVRIKEKWIACTKRENWLPSNYSVVCSRHFTEDCFYAMKNRRRIIESAIPTMHLPKVSNTAVTPDRASDDIDTIPSSTSKNLQTFTAPNAIKRGATDAETPLRFHSPTKKPLLLSSSKTDLISTTLKATKSKATDPETHLLFHSPTKKPLLLSSSKTEPISTTPIVSKRKATDPETLSQFHSPTKKRLPLPQPKNELISTTPKATKRKATDPETLTQFHSPTKKRLYRRVVELSNKVEQKNKTIKELRDKVRYYKKRVASLKFIKKDLDKKSLIRAEDANIINKMQYQK